jgi:anti-sigma factor RsiW
MHHGSATAHDDWNVQRETISAYVDDALPPDERARFERHLATCDACQRELAEMRDIRTLLRALPQPVLPRSFALPADVPNPLPTPARAAATVVRPDAETWQRRAGRLAQRVGALAAAAGVMLVLGSALLSHARTFSTASGTLSARPSNAQLAPTANTSTPRSPGGQFGASQHTPAGTQGSQPSQSATESVPSASGAPTQAQSPPRSADQTPPPVSVPGTSESPPFLPLTGTGLIVGGAAVAAAGSVLSRRGQRGSRHRR